ncbi:hypothetical protein [Streptomyces sp. NPDC000878]
MTTSSFSSSHRRRIAVVASALVVIALPAALFTLVAGAGVPESWWPRTGQAFSVDAHAGSARQDPCNLVVGPGTKYCERDTASATPSAAGTLDDRASAVWMVVPPAAGLAAGVVVWRRRGTAGHGRR